LHKNTEILTLDGIKKVKDFVSASLPVYSKKGDSCKIVVPSETQKIKSPNKLLSIKTALGISFATTLDHELLVSTNKGYKMKKAKELTTEDYLVKSSKFYCPSKEYCVLDLLDDNYLIEQKEIKELCKEAMIQKFGSIRKMNKKTNLDRKVFLTKSKNSISIKHLKISGIYDKIKQKVFRFKTQKGRVIEMKNLSKEHLYLLGLIASDGNNTKEKKTRRYTRIKFHNKEEALIDKFLEIYKRLFPTIPISKKKVKENLFELDSSNSLFATIAAKLGVLSPEKNSDLLPILHCNNKLIKSFLRGYFDGDGNAYYAKKNNGKGIYSNIRIYCAYYHIIKKIHQMLLKLDISNKIIEAQTNFGRIFMSNVIDLKSKKRFASEVGSYHPLKKNYLKKIASHNKTNHEDYRYVPFHYKDNLRKYKNKLSRLGGNLKRVLNSSVPLTLGIYEKASNIISLPKLDEFYIEKIVEIKEIKGSDYVYDMTIPETHNFLIETGYVSSNCHDLGEELEVGAHMLELRRVRAGIFKEDDKDYPCVNLYDFERIVENYKKSKIFSSSAEESSNESSKEYDKAEKELRDIIIPAEIVGDVYDIVEIKNGNLKSILTGKPIYKKDLKEPTKVKKEADVSVFCEERFIGMYEVIREDSGTKSQVSSAKDVERKEIFAKAKFVLQPIK